MQYNDLTQGPVFKTMLSFAFPMILGNLLQQMYNIIDDWVVGHYVSSDALAAVGSAFNLMTLLTSVLLGLSLGSSVVFSLCFGRSDHRRLQDSLRASFVMIAAVTVFLTLLPLIWVDGIITWLNIPAEIIPLIREYLVLIFWGIPAVFLYNYFAAFLRAMGNSVVPLLFLGSSTLLNIVLALLFVAVFCWGIAGAAIATVISQYTVGIALGIYVLRKYPAMGSALKPGRLDPSCIRQVAAYSFLTCLQQSVMNLGVLAVQSLVNSFGATVMAAFSAACKMDALAFMPVMEYGNAFSTFVAQNAGAGKKERITTGIRYAFTTAVIYSILISLALWFCAKYVMYFFVDPSETAIVQIGIQYLHIEGSAYCFSSILFLCYGLYRALGKPGMSFVLTVVSLGVRVALSYSLAAIPAIGVIGIWWSIPIGWFLADVVGIVYFAVRRRELLRLE